MHLKLTQQGSSQAQTAALTTAVPSSSLQTQLAEPGRAHKDAFKAAPGGGDSQGVVQTARL